MRLGLLGLLLFYAVGATALGGGVLLERINAGWPMGSALDPAVAAGLRWPLEVLAAFGL